MKIVPVALILVVLAAVVLWFGDNFYSWGPGGLFRDEVTLLILLFSIPVSLSLFFFLSLRQQEKDPQHRQEDELNTKR
jgi:hypothetical protein